jgi:dTDP-glucose 4,6-dehydratase
MRIMVIGSKGTLGVPLTAELRRRGHAVSEVDIAHHSGDAYWRADIAEFRQIKRAIHEARPALVYLLAAEFGRHNGEHYYEQLWRTNVIGTRNVLELQQQYDFRLIFTSSSEIYGELGAVQLSESLSEQVPLHQPNDYAMTKWVNELQCVNFAKAGNEIMRLRLFNAYGPGEHYHRYRSVVCLFAYRMLHGLQHEVYRNYYRVFQYVDDLIRTMATAADSFVPGGVYNLGGSEYTSVEDMRAIIIDCLSKDERRRADECVIYRDTDQHNVVSKRPDISLAVSHLGHNPSTMLADGIPATVAWMREQYGTH